jgi:hypothetical protein
VLVVYVKKTFVSHPYYDVTDPKFFFQYGSRPATSVSGPDSLSPELDLGFLVNPDPDPGFDDQKFKNFIVGKHSKF